MKKILVIDESELFRDFLKHKLETYGFTVALGINGLDGLVKMRQEMPDLIIMDYYLSRQSSVEVLEKKVNDPNIKDVPVIVASSQIDRKTIMEVSKYNVYKFFNKPVRIDSLLKTVSEVLNISVSIDNTPCIIEAHFNDEILFVEIAQGLNNEKIELLRYKITELLQLYQVSQPKVLVLMSSVDISSKDSLKLNTLLSIVKNYSNALPENIKILTNNTFVRKYIAEKKDFQEIEVTNNLEHAMDGLLGKKAEEYIDSESKIVKNEFLSGSGVDRNKDETIHLKFKEEVDKINQFDLSDLKNGVFCVVDDDFVIQELIKTAFSDTDLTIKTYNNGKEFIEDSSALNADIVFLDLMMPEMDGFQTLKYLRDNNINLQIIVLSALSKRETVVKALQYGVTSYVIKPLKPEWVRKKATEIVKMNF